MHRVIKALAILVMGLTSLFPPPTYGEADEGGVDQFLLRMFTPTPLMSPSEFTTIRNTPAQRHLKIGRIWEEDRDQHSGSMWKVWEYEKDWATSGSHIVFGRMAEL